MMKSLSTKQIRKELEESEAVRVTQSYDTGLKIIVDWARVQKNRWLPVYSSTSTYHICPNTGNFEDCRYCEAYDEDRDKFLEKCYNLWKKEVVTDEVLVGRLVDAAKDAWCTIEFRRKDE